MKTETNKEEKESQQKFKDKVSTMNSVVFRVVLFVIRTTKQAQLLKVVKAQ